MPGFEQQGSRHSKEKNAWNAAAKCPKQGILTEGGKAQYG